MGRKERESDRRRREEKRSGRLVGAAEASRACRMAQVSAEKLEHSGPAEKEEWRQCHRESSWQVRQSRPCQKEKEQSRLSRGPDLKVGESQDGRESHLGDREGDQSGSMKRKEWAPL